MRIRRVLLLLSLFAASMTWQARPADATFPGSNGRIVFSGGSSFTAIHTFDPATNRIIQLTTPPAGFRDVEPAWSPASSSGSRIAFSRVSDFDGRAEIFVMNADGSGLQQLTSSGVFTGFPGWSPDGNRLVVSGGVPNGDWFLHIIDAGTGAVLESLTFGSSVRDVNANWSPDGRRIVYEREIHRFTGGGQRFKSASDLYIRDVTSGGNDRLTNNFLVGQSSEQPKWSPDGRKIVFSHSQSTNPCICLQVFVVDPGNVESRANPTRLSRTARPEIHPTWSPDGSYVTFSRPFFITPGGLYRVASSDGDDELRLTDFGAMPDWEPLTPRITLPTIDTLRRDTAPLIKDVGRSIRIGPALRALPPIKILPEEQTPRPDPIPMPQEACQGLPGLLPAGVSARLESTLTRPGRPDFTRTHTVAGLQPALVSVDEDCIPEFSVQLVPLGAGLQLKVYALPAIDLLGLLTYARPAVRLEAILDDAALNALEELSEGRIPGQLVSTNEYHFGFDARDSVAPVAFEATVVLPSDERILAHFDTTSQWAIGGLRTDRLTLIAGTRTVARNSTVGVPVASTGGSLRMEPVPDEVDLAIDGSDPLIVEVASSQASRMTAAMGMDDGRSGRGLSVTVADVPVRGAAPAGSLLNPNSIAVAYAHSTSILTYHSSRLVTLMDVDVIDGRSVQSAPLPNSTTTVGFLAHGVPTDVRLNLRAGPDPAVVGLAADWDASGTLADATLDVYNPQGVGGPGVNALHLYVERLAPHVDVRLGNPAHELIDAQGDEIGLVEVGLGSTAELASLPIPLAPAFDGVTIRDFPPDSAFYARITGLRLLRLVRRAQSPEVCAPFDLYRFCLELRKSVPRPFVMDTSSHGGTYTTVRLDDLQPTTVLKLGNLVVEEHEGRLLRALRFFYDASGEATSFTFDTNADGSRNTHVELNPVPRHVEGCLSPGTTCAGRPARFGSRVGSIAFSTCRPDQPPGVPCDRSTISVVNDMDDANGLALTGRLSQLRFMASVEKVDPAPGVPCLGGPGEIFVDTASEPASLVGNMRQYDPQCSANMDLQISVPEFPPSGSFRAVNRYVTFTHPTHQQAFSVSGSIFCPSFSTRIEVVEILPGIDADLDGFLCGSSTNWPPPPAPAPSISLGVGG